MITIENLSKSFKTKQVLKGINLSTEPGKVYGIVGANGAGKTTLFRCIAGLEIHEGEIHSTLNPLKNHLGFLQTNPYFFSHMNGAEYVYLLCNARNKKIKDINQKNIFDLPLNQFASTYSTGMQKKLALTAILLQENDFLILDEPFNGVDIQSNIIITEIIHKLKSLGKTILISSHIFSTLSDTCDEIYLLQEGQFTRRVFQEEFKSLEEEMRAFSVGSLIDNFNLK